MSIPLMRAALYCAAAALVTAPTRAVAQASPRLDTAGVVVPPRPRGFVNDYAQVLTASDVAKLDSVARDVRTRSRGEIAVVTVPSLAGHTARGVAVAYANRWGVGYRGAPGDPANNTGVVVLLAPNDHQVFIATSDAVREFLPDEKAMLISRMMTPAFMKGEYGRGLLVGVSQIAIEYGKHFHFTPRVAMPKATFSSAERTAETRRVRLRT